MLVVLFIVALLVIIGMLVLVLQREMQAEMIYYPPIEPRTITAQRYKTEYTNLGYIQSEEGEYPLWGVRSATRKHRWHYYTTNDPNNPSSRVKLPVSYSGRDCMDELGCDEIYENENVSVGGRTENYRVHLYR